jgi:3-deoxy-manno-octulosonate cytidylyltransferase (CMP-KDO synthetase)
MKFTVVIPARLASTRLPNKPLADIHGVPMVVCVARRCLQSSADRVVVAADSTAIVEACERFAIDAILTRNDHASGSDRLAEACSVLQIPDDAIVVNVQGDEPLIEPDLIGQVADLLACRPDCSMSTAAHAIESFEDFINPNVVKVVLDANDTALYFSRSPVPAARDHVGVPWWHRQDSLPSLPAPLRHIGIYAYRADFLRQFPQLSPAPFELLECLEQLRALWHGHRIAVHVTDHPPGPGVDTPSDLERARALLRP